jgi:hypothetical protein
MLVFFTLARLPSRLKPASGEASPHDLRLQNIIRAFFAGMRILTARTGMAEKIL